MSRPTALITGAGRGIGRAVAVALSLLVTLLQVGIGLVSADADKMGSSVDGERHLVPGAHVHNQAARAVEFEGLNRIQIG